jgi:hypothetical protein
MPASVASLPHYKTSVDVRNVAIGSAEYTYDPDRTSPAEIRAAIERIGFTPASSDR